MSTKQIVGKSGIIEWTNPTTRVDGSAFNPQSEIAGYRLYINGSALIDLFVGAGAQTSFDLKTLAAFQDFAAGNYTVSLSVLDTKGLESDPSDSDTFQVEEIFARPSKVSNFRVV